MNPITDEAISSPRVYVYSLKADDRQVYEFPTFMFKQTRSQLSDAFLGPLGSWCSSVGVENRVGAGQPRNCNSILREQGMFVFSKMFGSVLWPTQLPTEWVPGVKRPEHDVGHSPPPSVGVKNDWIYTMIAKHGFMAYTGTTWPQLFACTSLPHTQFIWDPF
jgi:hypothetical protein